MGAGPPKRNWNAASHYLTSDRSLVLGRLPRGCEYIIGLCRGVKTHLERAVIDVRGDITLSDAMLIQTAVRWERHAQLAQRWLRRESENMSVDQRLQYSREVARASAERDKCVKQLRIERDTADTIAALYRHADMPLGDTGDETANEPTTAENVRETDAHATTDGTDDDVPNL